MAKRTLLQQSSRTNGYPKSIRIYTIFRSWGKISPSIYRELQNQKKHTHLIEQIRTKFIELEQDEWKVEFSWIKAHEGHRGNELADRLAKEAASSRTIDECYTRIPKSAVLCELNEQSVNQWQNEWESTQKMQ